MVSETRTTPRGLARYAKEYFDCALAAHAVMSMRPMYKEIAPAPVMFLVAQTMELAFKSYLKSKGASNAEIRKLGHNLIACWQNSIAQGIGEIINFSADEADLLSQIGALHSSTELRYIQTGFKQLPKFAPLQNLTSKILDAVCTFVGYKY